MAQPRPDGVDVHAGPEQMDGRSVAQGLLILLMNCTQLRFAIGVIRSMAQKLK